MDWCLTFLTRRLAGPFSIVFGVLLFGIFSGCGPGKPSTGPVTHFSGNYPIKVVCTTGHVAEMVRKVGGEHVEVIQLMGEGVDPHSYEAFPQDVTSMAEADLIFYSGLHLEADLVLLFERMSNKKLTFAVTAELEQNADQRLIKTEGDLYDPHVWFDATLWSDAVEYVAKGLCDFDPDHQEHYHANANVYQKELREIHEYCRQQIQSVPEKQRVLVTAHDAFHYFGNAYGIQVRAIQGVSTTQETSVKDLNELVEFIVQNNIKAVFSETSVAGDKVAALVEGCAARNHIVKLGEEQESLFSDAMGKPGTAEGTYAGMMRHNVDTIVKALR